MDELISVIVPIYNTERYLKECIDSIINQTYKNLEIILVDDGSTDNSAKICDEYKELDSRINVIHKENGGVSSARNCALEIASGKYIAFLDSDDLIHKDMYKILEKIMSENNSDIVICDSHTFNENEMLPVMSKICECESEVYESYKAFKLFESASAVNAISIWNKLYRADLFNTLRFPEGKLCEDIYVNLKAFLLSKKISYVNKLLHFYRCRKGSLMHNGKLPTEDSVVLLNSVIDDIRSNVYDSVKAKECINIVTVLKVNIILDGYYLSRKRKLDKATLMKDKQLYDEVKPYIKKENLRTFKMRLFEINKTIFYYAMSIYCNIND